MTGTSHSSLDIYMLLTERRQIAIVWGIEDVQEVRPDLDDEQAWLVLQECGNKHDAECGINWEYIRCIAGFVFPEKD